MRSPTQLSSRVAYALLLGLLLGLLILWALSQLLLTDPAAAFFYKAQKLEAAGMLDLARRHYAIVSEGHPTSSFAPQALQRQAEIIAGGARRTGDTAATRQAVQLLLRLANTYPENRLAADALLAAGNIALTDLQDAATARQAFLLLLKRYPNNRSNAGEAMLRLGRTALLEQKRDEAQQMLQRVLQLYGCSPELAAEAQYHLGVLYETLFKNPEWAKNAYLATTRRYPATMWAAQAQTRLGMVWYAEVAGTGGIKRVLAEVAPVDSEPVSGGLLAALRPLLAARGLRAGATTLEGWSQEPFVAGYNPDNPADSLEAEGNRFDNIMSAAGLLYSVSYGGNDANRLRALQNELDAGRVPLVYDGKWQVAVGYDSYLGQVYLQQNGPQLRTVSVKDFKQAWKTNAPEGGAFTLLAVYAPGEQTTRPPGATPTPAATSTPVPAVPGGTPPAATSPTRPTWSFRLKQLSAAACHRRALRAATSRMSRARLGKFLLNLEALGTLAREVERLGQPGKAALPAPAAAPTAGSDAETTAATNPVTNSVPEAPLEEPAGTAGPAEPRARLRRLLGWFGDPLTEWLRRRQAAASYLEQAAGALGSRSASEAARELRHAIKALEDARALLPEASAVPREAGPLDDDLRRRLLEAAAHLRRARTHEGRATNAMARAT